ncbi:MAG: hypothetical protein IKY27_08605 [Bacteroidales bacterium]|nr:hypothetical protein [Bacteroidales bacterium]
MSELKNSLKATASFRVTNKNANGQRVCFFPGHYDTAEVVSTTDSKYMISYADPTAINNAGYDCKQVADDYSSKNSLNKADGSGTYPVTIQPKNGKTRYRDFLNMIKLSGLKVSKIRFTDLVANGNHEIFGQDLEISQSTIGGKGGTDIVNLSAHINPSHFLQNFIDVDLAGNNLRLDETTLMFMEIPAGADFQIEFTLA